MSARFDWQGRGRMYGVMIWMILSISLSSSLARAQYNDLAGKNTVEGGKFSDPVKKDEHGNLKGSDYDLAIDGAFDGQLIVILNLCDCLDFDINVSINALRRKGFRVEVMMPGASPEALGSTLKDANQLWVISGPYRMLDAQHGAVIQAFFERGRGLYLLGDNDPYFQDVNVLARRLFGDASLEGNLPGEGVVGIKRRGMRSGIIEDHMLSTGLESMYEGITIATVKPGKRLVPFLWGSQGNVVAAYHDGEQRRAILDGGFTRLESAFVVKAGTERYIVNAAAWLANVERFGDEVLSEELKKPLEITSKLGVVKLGQLVPGGRVHAPVYINGEFSKQQLRLTLDGGGRGLPRCAAVKLDGKRLGVTERELAPGDRLLLDVEASSYCGARIERGFDGAIQVEARRAGKWERVGKIKFSFDLLARVSITMPATIALNTGGGAHLFYAATRSNALEATTFRVRLEQVGASQDEAIGLRIFSGEDRAWSKGSASAREHIMDAREKQRAIRFGARAGSCCASGVHDAVAIFEPIDGNGPAIRVPFKLEAKGSDFVGCWGDRLWMLLIALVLLLIAAYLFNIWRQSHFLNRRRVVAALMPLRWDEWGEPIPQEAQVLDVKRMVWRGMSWWARLWAFIRANPLKIGWYRGAYYETIQLYLEPSRDITRSRVVMLSERDFLSKLRRAPSLGLGRCYICARGGMSAVAVPDREGRVGRLEYRDPYGAWQPPHEGEGGEEEDNFEIVKLRKDNLLDIASEREADLGAGWRVG